MNKQEIFEDIKYIKQVMASSTKYTNLSGIANIISGIFAILGYFVTIYLTSKQDIHFFHPFIITWLLVFLIAIFTNIFFMIRKAKRTKQPVWTRLSRIIVDALSPYLLVGASLTIFFVLNNASQWLPVTWMGMYGLGLWSASFFSVKEVRILSILFLTTATFCLFFALSYSMLLLAISFGGYHIIYGLCLYHKYGE